MSNFVYDNLPLPESKSDRGDLPEGVPTSQAIRATDFNTVGTYLGDLRTAVNALTGVPAGTAPSLLPVLATGSTTGRFLGDRFAEVFDVKDFGAKGDGATDDTAAIQAAINAALVKGGTVYFPLGYYRTTATLNVGLPEYTGYGFIADRTTNLVDADFSAMKIQANVDANKRAPAVGLDFAEHAFILADWLPSVPTPVVSYNLHGDYRRAGSIRRLSVITSGAMVAGAYSFPDSGIATNKLIGLYCAGGSRVVDQCFFSKLGYGLVSANPFWVRFGNLRAEYCGVGFSFAQANAATVDNVEIWYSGKGVVFDGGASTVTNIHTEQVAEELTIFFAECCTFGPGYLEDVDPSDGTGKYAVTLGTSGSGQKVVHCDFRGLRSGAMRPNKGAFRIWDTRKSTFVACRSYGSTVTADASCTGATVNCDFTVTPVGFMSLDAGALSVSDVNLYRNSANTWKTDDALVVTGLLTVLNDISISSTGQGVNWASAWLQYKSGNDLYIRDLTNARMQAQYTAGNASNNAHTQFFSKVSVGAALTLARSSITYATTMTPNSDVASEFEIVPTDAAAFTIAAPLNALTGRRILIRIRNTTAGALGAVTWNATYKMAAWTQPAAGFSRSIEFSYNGTNWVETSRTPSDVPN